MARKRCARAVFTVLGVFLILLSVANCSSTDEVPPTATLTAPDTIFINATGGSEYVRLRGTARDNVKITQVEVSLDAGSSYPYAITGLPFGGFIDWDLSVPAGDFSTPTTTIVVRATDGEGNTGESAAAPVSVVSSNLPQDLRNLLSTADTGDVIYLSSGSGSAYDTSLVITRALTVAGHGFGDAVTAGGYSATGDTPATVLSVGAAEDFVLRTTADLDLSGVRISGAAHGLKAIDNDVNAVDLAVSVRDCLFEDQGAWGLLAEKIIGGDTLDDLLLSVQDSGVDASQAASFDGGGLRLTDAVYSLFNVDVRGAVTSSGYHAGLLIEGGSGAVESSFFGDNAVAIWASGGAPNVISCSIIGSPAITTAGVTLSGVPTATPVIEGNEIAANSEHGLLISGEATPRVRSNVIRDNEGAGIVIDFRGDAPEVVNIDLGTSTDAGNNDLFGNVHPAQVGFPTQLFVTSAATDPGQPVPAELNYWGTSSAALVNQYIIDGNDVPTYAGRARIDPAPFRSSPAN